MTSPREKNVSDNNKRERSADNGNLDEPLSKKMRIEESPLHIKRGRKINSDDVPSAKRRRIDAQPTIMGQGLFSSRSQSNSRSFSTSPLGNLRIEIPKKLTEYRRDFENKYRRGEISSISEKSINSCAKSFEEEKKGEDLIIELNKKYPGFATAGSDLYGTEEGSDASDDDSCSAASSSITTGRR